MGRPWLFSALWVLDIEAGILHKTTWKLGSVVRVVKLLTEGVLDFKRVSPIWFQRLGFSGFEVVMTEGLFKRLIILKTIQPDLKANLWTTLIHEDSCSVPVGCLGALQPRQIILTFVID